MGQAIDQHSLKFHKLPSKLRGVVGKEWVTDCGGISVRDFAMDPREDLLVVVELAPQCNIHILTLSTGKPHPLSLSPKIQAPALKGDEARSFKIIISGYLVGVMVLTRRPPDTPQRVLVVYDWRSGGLIMVRSLPHPLKYCLEYTYGFFPAGNGGYRRLRVPDRLSAHDREMLGASRPRRPRDTQYHSPYSNFPAHSIILALPAARTRRSKFLEYEFEY